MKRNSLNISTEKNLRTEVFKLKKALKMENTKDSVLPQGLGLPLGDTMAPLTW